MAEKASSLTSAPSSLDAVVSPERKDPRDYVHATPFENLFVLPSNGELGEIEHMLESKHKIYKLRGC